MSLASNLLEQCRAADIRLFIESGCLSYRCVKGTMSPELKEQLINNIHQIVEILRPPAPERPVAVYRVRVDEVTITVINPGKQTLDEFSEAMSRKFGRNRVQSVERVKRNTNKSYQHER